MDRNGTISEHSGGQQRKYKLKGTTALQSDEAKKHWQREKKKKRTQDAKEEDKEMQKKTKGKMEKHKRRRQRRRRRNAVQAKAACT